MATRPGSGRSGQSGKGALFKIKPNQTIFLVVSPTEHFRISMPKPRTAGPAREHDVRVRENPVGAEFTEAGAKTGQPR